MKMHLGTSLTDPLWSDFFAESDSKTGEELMKEMNLCVTLCDPTDCNPPDSSVHHQFPEFTQTHVHQVIDAIQPFYPLLSPNPSQHQSLFQWVNSPHQVAKVLDPSAWTWAAWTWELNPG